MSYMHKLISHKTNEVIKEVSGGYFFLCYVVRVSALGTWSAGIVGLSKRIGEYERGYLSSY